MVTLLKKPIGLAIIVIFFPPTGTRLEKPAMSGLKLFEK